MEYIKLLGILIVIVGFALKWETTFIIVLSAAITAVVGGIGPVELIELAGTTFMTNRSMMIFVLVLLVTGTLERNGLKEGAAALIRKIKGANAGVVIAAYAMIRSAFGAFNVGIGGVAGFIRPVLMPMAVGTLEAKKITPNEKHVDELKGICAGIENITWFFFQVLFVGGSGAQLVKSTLASLGYEVELIDLALAEIPIALTALVVGVTYVIVKDKLLTKKYYKD